MQERRRSASPRLQEVTDQPYARPPLLPRAAARSARRGGPAARPGGARLLDLGELPLLVAERAVGARAQPLGDAVQVEDVAAGAPGDAQALLGGAGGVGLVLDGGLVEGVAADGARVRADAPAPHGHRVPFLRARSGKAGGPGSGRTRALRGRGCRRGCAPGRLPCRLSPSPRTASSSPSRPLRHPPWARRGRPQPWPPVLPRRQPLLLAAALVRCASGWRKAEGARAAEAVHWLFETEIASVRTRIPCDCLVCSPPSVLSVPMKKPWLPAGTAPALLETERCRLRCVPWACSLRRPDPTPGRSSSLTSSKTGTRSCPRETRYSSASDRTWTGPQRTSPCSKARGSTAAPPLCRHCDAATPLLCRCCAAALPLLLCGLAAQRLRLQRGLTPPPRRAAPPLLAALPPPLLTRLCRHG